MKHPDPWLAEARRRHEVALFLFAHGHFPDAVTRTFYALYAAAQHLLLREGITAKTHHGMIRMLGMHFVQNHRLSATHLATYQYTLQARMEADYDLPGTTAPHAKRCLDLTALFLSAIDELT